MLRLLIDDDQSGDRTCGEFTTDGAVAYVRQDPAGKHQTLVLAAATQLQESSRTLINSTESVTVEVSYAADQVALTLPEVPEAEVRIYAPGRPFATFAPSMGFAFPFAISPPPLAGAG
jgi:hypothetical protein